MQKHMLCRRGGVRWCAAVVTMIVALLAGPAGIAPAANAASGTAGILVGEVVSSASGVGITRSTTVTIEPGGLSFSTNTNGLFTLMLDAGTYQVTAAAPTFGWTGSDPVQVTVSAGQVTTVQPVITPPDTIAELRGKVYDEQLQPLHARVTLFDSNGDPVTGDTTSSTTGNYKISGGGHIQPATYTAKVEAIDLTTCNIDQQVITFYPADRVTHNVQLVCGPPPELAPANWSNTGDMVVARFNHHASLLPDGRVLVVGGSPQPVRPLDTEIFDLATGTWTWAGGMITPRSQAKTVTLPDDRVLVMGGRDAAGNDVLSVEVFNPATEQWSVVGNIPAPVGGAAVALADGRVLVTWGVDLGPDLCAADSHTAIFDPADGSWTELADDDNRFPFQLTLLSDGRVLDTGGTRPTIIGGATGCQNNLTTDARLFDPVTGQWTVTTDMPDLGNSSTTLLADGTVLVIASAFEFGTTAGAPGRAKTYDPATETWTQTDPMNRFRGARTATRLNDGQVLVTGGGSSTFGTTATAEIYNPGTRTWTAIQGMNNERALHTATVLNDGRVLIAGVDWQRATSGSLTLSAEIFTP